jgi:hypothetical protein
MGGRSAVNTPTAPVPKYQPGPSAKKIQGVSHFTPSGANVNVLASNRRRWTHRPTLSATLYDLACTTIVVCVWVAMITGIILAMCTALWVIS